jgi:hypothetical protein
MQREWERRPGAMRPSIKHQIAARARLPQPSPRLSRYSGSGSAASARCGLGSNTKSPRGRGSHSHPRDCRDAAGVGAPPRRDAAFDQTPNRREGAAPTAIPETVAMQREWERRLGAMRPLIKHQIAARARLPQPSPRLSRYSGSGSAASARCGLRSAPRLIPAVCGLAAPARRAVAHAPADATAASPAPRYARSG